MLRRGLVVLVLAGLLGSGSVVIPPVVAGVPPLAPADGASDVSETPSVPLPHLPLPNDPADAISGLPYELDTVPDDASGSTALGDDWSQVPGLPVEVQVPGLPVEVQADTVVEPSTTETPSTAPSPTAPSPSATDEATAGDDVVVSVDQPEDLSQGVLLVSVDVAESPDTTGATAPTTPSAPSSSPSPSDSAAPSESPSPTATLTDAPGLDSTGVPAEGVGVRVSYDAFDQAYGAGWSDRLIVMAYPACYATTPELPECGAGVPVEAVNDPVTNTLTFTTLPADQIGDPDGLATASPAPSATESPSPEIIGEGGVAAAKKVLTFGWNTLQGGYYAATHPKETAQAVISGVQAHLSGCADHDLSSCGGLWLDIVSLEAGGGAAALKTARLIDRVNEARKLRSLAKKTLSETAGGLTNLGRAGSQLDLNEFSSGQGFSGVYDDATGSILAMPSSRASQLPANWVSARGGPGVVNARLSQALGTSSGGRSGFTAFLDEAGGLRVEWLSRSVNGAANPYVSEALRPRILEALANATGRATY